MNSFSAAEGVREGSGPGISRASRDLVPDPVGDGETEGVVREAVERSCRG